MFTYSDPSNSNKGLLNNEHVPYTELLSNTTPGGSAETCFASEIPNVGSKYPKISACCPLVILPIQTNSDDTLFYIYEDTNIEII